MSEFQKNKTIIYIGSDHAGYEAKKQILYLLNKNNYMFNDCGTYSNNSCDYPDIAYNVCEKVLSNSDSFGIVICGSGIGISIAANKIKGIRCGLIYNKHSAILAKQHNNCNVLAFGGREFDYKDIFEWIELNLNTKFEGNRHQLRINKIFDLEK